MNPVPWITTSLPGAPERGERSAIVSGSSTVKGALAAALP